MTQSSVRPGGIAALSLAIAVTGGVAGAEPAAPRRPLPLSEAVTAAAIKNSSQLTQVQSAKPRKSSSKRVAIGGLIGLGAGAGLATWLLASTGGSDAAGRIIFNFSAVGTIAGFGAGAAACDW